MAIPHVVLINPPIYDFAFFDLHHKPYGLLRLGRWLQQSGYRVSVLDYMDYSDRASVRALGRPRRKQDGTGKIFRTPVQTPGILRDIPRSFSRYGILPESAESKLASLQPDLVLTSTTMTYWYRGLIEVADAVRKYHPKTPIVAGGPYVSLCSEHAARVLDIDHLVAGDAWPALAGILGEHGLPLPDGPPPDEVLPDPAALRVSAPLRLNRGCPFRCAYCASPVLTDGLHAGDPEYAFRLLLELREVLGVSHIAFYDDALLAHKDDVLKPFLRRVIQRDLGVTFAVPNALHLSLLDAETASLMRRAGFSEVRLGYESAQREFHSSLDHKVAPGMLSDCVAMLRAAGFAGHEITAYVLAGLPGQVEEEVMASVDTVFQERIRVSIAEFSPLPATPLWESCVEKSVYPLETEPLFHNNTVQPMSWQGLDGSGLRLIKDRAIEVSTRAR